MSNLKPIDVLKKGPIIPVIVIDKEDDALFLAEALLKGGIHVLEITLRTDTALSAIKRIASKFPDLLVGAGTVLRPDDLLRVRDNLGVFAISPGITPTLLESSKWEEFPLLPGISTPSELMMGLDFGFSEFKFFPAEAAGGLPMLKALSGPFPDVRFCPTGGINEGNYLDYLSLKNCLSVGGSWICPRSLIRERKWDEITSLCKNSLKRS